MIFIYYIWTTWYNISFYHCTSASSVQVQHMCTDQALTQLVKLISTTSGFNFEGSFRPSPWRYVSQYHQKFNLETDMVWFLSLKKLWLRGGRNLTGLDCFVHFVTRQCPLLRNYAVENVGDQYHQHLQISPYISSP